MSERTHTENRDGTTESKFYLPVGVSPSPEATLLERIQQTLFNHRI